MDKVERLQADLAFERALRQAESRAFETMLASPMLPSLVPLMRMNAKAPHEQAEFLKDLLRQLSGEALKKKPRRRRR